jgi:hypothetical protein
MLCFLLFEEKQDSRMQCIPAAVKKKTAAVKKGSLMALRLTPSM